MNNPASAPDLILRGWRAATSSRQRLAFTVALAALALLLAWPTPGPSISAKAASAVSSTTAPSPAMTPAPSAPAPVVYTAKDGSTRTCAPARGESAALDCGEGGMCTASPTGITCSEAPGLGTATPDRAGKCPPGQLAAAGMCVTCPAGYAIDASAWCTWTGQAATTVKP